ncbi:hypothetical protein Q3V23_08730 [Streptomyces sp. VNUA116]|uniref:hypothetical protein n=1 Tax=Streptomyces sp. VNUA116 TaxID=3062449 RepID=UPI0026769BFC|nr:hypothetical protein [Streptomyces sp. VNUA116]WKU44163.1 hypothetical protein Q3V23_08730 [Streptomyces sp. VNUA116]
MRQFISRWFGWTRLIPVPGARRPRRPDSDAAAARVEPEAVPAVAAPPREGGSTCGVYVWATAHGIDLSYPGPLGSCTCSARPHPEPPFEPRAAGQSLRAKVREANAASRWGK